MSKVRYTRGRTADRHAGVPVPPALPSTLGPWLRAHLPGAPDASCHLPMCRFGVATTTRANVHAHPREVWDGLATTLDVGRQPTGEGGFFCEWGMGALYGALAGRARGPCGDP